MARGEMVGKFLFRSTIYNVDLPKALIQQMKEKQWEFNSKGTYEVEILFGKDVYEIKDFYKFPVSVGLPKRKDHIERDEKKRILQGDILRQQRDNVVQALRTAGVNVWNAGIIANGFAINFIKIVLYKHEVEMGKPEERADYVMPVWASNAYRSSLVIKLLEESMRKAEKEWRERTQKTQLTLNWGLAEELFSEIAQSVYPSDYDKAMAHKEMLYSAAIQISNCPLQIKSKSKAESGTPLGKDAKLHYPEYAIYIQDTNGDWSIDETENLKTAQEMIVKRGYNQKRTARIIVLHNVKSVPYTLFTQTDEGLVEVSHEEARGEKKLFLSWNK